MDYVTLNNGIKMPQLGFGVFQIPDGPETEQAVSDALEVSYRSIDTAAAYGNEAAVGRAIAQSGIPRDEVFVTTKLWVNDVSYEGAKRGFEQSLKKLDMDYIYLYLIRQPLSDVFRAWCAMEELYQRVGSKVMGGLFFQYNMRIRRSMLRHSACCGLRKGVAMAFDYKREYKEFYAPPKKPTIVDVPMMNFIAVRGKGDPNSEEGEYKDALGMLYAIAFTIKMSKRGGHAIEGYFDYVVPPLEGFWKQKGSAGAIDYSRKSDFEFISCIRLPEFVGKDDFDWAIGEAALKKGQDFSKVEFLPIEEGLCVQCMHIGPYDDEPATIKTMDEYAEEQGFEIDFSSKRLHHEIYLSDPRRCAPERLKTVVRHPVRPA